MEWYGISTMRPPFSKLFRALAAVLFLLAAGAVWLVSRPVNPQAAHRHGPPPVLSTPASPGAPVNAAAGMAAAFETQASLRAGGAVQLKENGRPAGFRLALDRLYLTDAPVSEREMRTAALDAAALLAEAQAHAVRTARWPGLVLFPADDPPAEAGLDAEELEQWRESQKRVLTERVLIRASDPGAAGQAAEKAGLRVVRRPEYAPDHLIAEAASPLAALDALDALSGHPSVASAEPLLLRKRALKLLPDDPLFPKQWHLRNTGQEGGKKGVDANVTEVWDEYQGEGVRIAIVDDGLQTSHPDLAANVDAANHYDWNDKPADTDPSPNVLKDYHGTAVAGVAAARGGNGAGVSGLAPRATLVGFRLIADLFSAEDEADAMVRGMDLIQVKNNSWGIADGYPWELGHTGALFGAAMSQAATLGRGGLGTISVWAAGNGRHRGDQGGKDGYAGNRHAITVGAVTNKGRLAFYSETGAHLCVAAPSAESRAGIVTTDLASIRGYNDGLDLKNLGDIDYTNDFNGTSASAPVVAGVVALMLEANPSLNWRDVKEILLRSSTQVGGGSGWVSRDARPDLGLPAVKHHHSFGGGLVNARAAVDMAETWASPGAEVEIVKNASAGETGAASVKNTTILLPEETKKTLKVNRLDLDFSDSTALRVEHVTVTLSITHAKRGDMTVKLVSPSGTVSILASASARDVGADYSDWTFTSLRHWGESSRGVWSVITHEPDDGSTGKLNAAAVRLFGTAAPAAEVASVPQDALLVLGAPLSLTGSATGQAPLSRWWMKNGKAIPGATADSLGIASVKLSDAGAYDYLVSNLTGFDGARALVAVMDRALASQNLVAGKTATFRAHTAGPAGLRHQWFKGVQMLEDDGRVTGARTATLVIRNVSNADAEDYFCRVSLGELSLDTLRGTLGIIQRPVVQAPDPAEFFTYASGSLEYQIESDNAPTRFTARGLPPGLKLDPKTGLITGRPDKPGIYTVTVTASNAAGTSASATAQVEIAPLPPGTTGAFTGLVERLFYYNGGHGGSLTLTVAQSGRFTGRLTRGIYSTAFTGRLDIDPQTEIPEALVLIPRAAPHEPLELVLTLFEGSLEGDLSAPGEESIRVWGHRQEKIPASADIAGRYNAPLRGSETGPAFPLGTGHLSAVLSRQGGITLATRLADGTALTASGIPSPEGVLPLHRMLYRGTGSVQGEFVLDRGTPSLEAALTWGKSAQTPGSTRSYAAGFPVHDIGGTGGRYQPPAPGQPVLGLPLTAGNAVLTFTEGGLAVPFEQSLTLGPGGQAVFPPGLGNPHQLRLAVNRATGVITGTGKAMDIDPANPALNRQRPGTLSALIIPGEDLAEGHFLLPQDKSTAAPVLSGKVLLTAP